MTKALAKQFELMIAGMDEADKRELIDRLVQSMHAELGDTSSEVVPVDAWMMQLRAWAEAHPQHAQVDDGRESIYAGRGS